MSDQYFASACIHSVIAVPRNNIIVLEKNCCLLPEHNCANEKSTLMKW